MTQARTIIHGATYFLTRRVLHRKLLRPDPALTILIRYSLAIAVSRHEVQIHAFCASSTHIHLVVTDPNKSLPHFLRCFHHLVAMGVKRLHNWKGVVWDNSRTSVLRLLTMTAIKEKIAYTLANPVIVGAVSHADDWSGARSRVSDMGTDMKSIALPDFYFRSKSKKWPARVDLPISLPPGVTGTAAFREEIQNALDLIEEKNQNRNKQRKRKKQRKKVNSKPKRKVINTSSRVENSTIAAGNGHEDIFAAECAAMKAFRSSYRSALAQWRTGDRSANFPRGTWWMCEFHRANIDDSQPKPGYVSLPHQEGRIGEMLMPI
ncbi:MAG TPA: transposase [Polyangium sp.]|nr:transposase [Polyangium sp.]